MLVLMSEERAYATMFASLEDLKEAARKIYKEQTTMEQVAEQTKFDNDFGFNVPDAKILSELVKKFDRGDRLDTADQRTLARLMVKYDFQYALLINIDRLNNNNGFDADDTTDLNEYGKSGKAYQMLKAIINYDSDTAGRNYKLSYDKDVIDENVLDRVISEGIASDKGNVIMSEVYITINDFIRKCEKTRGRGRGSSPYEGLFVIAK